MPFDSTNFVTPNDDLLDLLIRARGRIQKSWIKGSFFDRQGGVCLVGSFANDIMNTLQNTAYDLLNSLVDPGISLIGFNDQPSTKKEDVLGLFDRAIALRREQLENGR